MKNKPLTYGLILAALGIWIYVFYFIFSAITGNDQIVTLETSKRTVDTSNVAQEQYSLLLNYTDPFLKKRDASFLSSTTSANSLVVRKPKPVDEKENQRKADLAKANEATMLFCKTVSYSGSIRNNASKKNIAILTIGEKEYMMAVGEAKDGVTLLKIVSDSVEVKCIDRKMYIKKGA